MTNATNRDEWAKQVAEWRASGLTAEEFSKERGLSKAKLWTWSSRLGRAERQAASGSRPLALARLVRRNEAQRPDAPVVVEWQGVRVSVGTGIDRGTLVTVLEAVSDVRLSARGVAR